MLEFDKNQQDNFSLLPDPETRFLELREAYEKTFRTDENFNSLVTAFADVMEEVRAVGLYPDSADLVNWLHWFSHEFERRGIQDASEMMRLGRLMLLCQTKEDMTNSINTYVFSALIPAREFQEAETWLRRGVKQDVGTQSINCLSNLGVLHYEQERFDEALLEFLLVYSTHSNWNRAEAAFYLAHVVADSYCRKNSVSKGLLLKVMSLSDSHYSLMARDCFAGRCGVSKKTFSKASSLSALGRDYSDSVPSFVLKNSEELKAIFTGAADQLEASGTVHADTSWRGKSIAYWAEQIQTHGINTPGLIEHLSERLVGEIEALVIVFAAGLTAKPDVSLAMGLSNCRYGVGSIVPHAGETLRFNSLVLSGGFIFEEHKLFANWSIETDQRYRDGSRFLDSLSPSQKNYLRNSARRETYFESSLLFTQVGAGGIDTGSSLAKESDKGNEIKPGENETLALIDLISNEFLYQLNQCILGERQLSNVSPEAICREALAKMERFTFPTAFDAESLMTRATHYSKERVETAWALDGEGKRLRAHVSISDLFGAIAISIAHGNLEWPLIQAGRFGVRDFQGGDNPLEENYKQIFPYLQLIWPLCWTLGARFRTWGENQTVPFDMKWSLSSIENSKDAETISFLLEGGQELDGHLPRIMSGKEKQGDQSILSLMTDDELSVVAKSKHLSADSIELIYPLAGPSTLASLLLNNSVPDNALEGSRWEAIETRMEIAWLVAIDFSDGLNEIDNETLDELTRAFSKTKNFRAAAKFASSPRLSDNHLRELALAGNDLIAEAVIANPNSSDETKALAKIGV